MATGTFCRMAASIWAILLIASCGDFKTHSVNDHNHVILSNETYREIGELDQNYLVIGPKKFAEIMADQNKESLDALLQPLSMDSSLITHSLEGEESTDTLVIGFPVKALGKEHLFGGVVTRVSNKQDQGLGRIKLANLTPVHVVPGIAGNSEEGYLFTLSGCIQHCRENSDRLDILSIPIHGNVNEGEEFILLDVSALGKGLNLVAMMDQNGQFTGLAPESSQTVAADYSKATLVFDVESHMVPRSFFSFVRPTTFTARWYLQQVDQEQASRFQSRAPREEVGFFVTERFARKHITRFPTPNEMDGGRIHYYLKNVPDHAKRGFEEGFASWNATFNMMVGEPLFTYEFIDADDPRHPLLVTGDVRYNIIEWDLDNLAPYGGLGPSIANQRTGEIVSGNVLVQGQSVETVYRRWFKIQDHVDQLNNVGHFDQAQRLIDQFHKQIDTLSTQHDQAMTFELSLAGIDMRIPGQMPEYHDGLARRLDFDEIPIGQTYGTYMEGFWRELVAHELGHNLGLRHNFRGNLGAKSEPIRVGDVSRSIMEYLGRQHRHLSAIGEYDLMAMEYALKGTPPQAKNWYCTDQDVPTASNPTNSAECMRGDITSDPFGYFSSRLDSAVNHLIAYGRDATPNWTEEEMQAELNSVIGALISYATSASIHAESWTNWHQLNRPSAPADIKDFVIDDVVGRVCSERIEKELASKTNAEAVNKATKNIQDLRKRVSSLMRQWGIDEPNVMCTL